MSKKILLSLVLFFLPVATLAAEGYVYDYSLIPSSLENIIELINLVLSVVAAIFAIKLAALSQGGQLEKTWNVFAVCAFVFAVIEFFGALKGFGLVNLGGIGDILELVFVSLFFSVFYLTRKRLLSQILGK